MNVVESRHVAFVVRRMLWLTNLYCGTRMLWMNARMQPDGERRTGLVNAKVQHFDRARSVFLSFSLYSVLLIPYFRVEANNVVSVSSSLSLLYTTAYIHTIYPTLRGAGAAMLSLIDL